MLQTFLQLIWKTFFLQDKVHEGVRIMEGHFLSPFTKFLPGIMPKEVETAKYEFLLIY